MHPLQATPRFVRLLLNAPRSTSSSTYSSSTHASFCSSFSRISNHRRTLFTTERSAMSLAGHNAREREFERYGPAGRRMGPSSNSQDLDRHRIDRPDIKASYIDTHCHMFTTFSMMKEVCSCQTSTARTRNRLTIPETRGQIHPRKPCRSARKALVSAQCKSNRRYPLRHPRGKLPRASACLH
jgi:hypothetical protein